MLTDQWSSPEVSRGILVSVTFYGDNERHPVIVSCTDPGIPSQSASKHVDCVQSPRDG